MLKNRRLRLHARVVKMDQVGVEIVFGHSQNPSHVFPVAGMHEIHSFAERLVVVKHRPAHEIGGEPLLSFGLLRQKRFVSDGAADVNSHPHPEFVHQGC